MPTISKAIASLFILAVAAGCSPLRYGEVIHVQAFPPTHGGEVHHGHGKYGKY